MRGGYPHRIDFLSSRLHFGGRQTDEDYAMSNIPETGFLRLAQIVGDQKRGIPPIIPVSRSTWWLGVKTGRFPQPVKLGPSTTAWRAEDIRDLITGLGGHAK